MARNSAMRLSRSGKMNKILLIVCSVFGVVILLCGGLNVSINQARTDARIYVSRNNMKQIALGLHHYHEDYGAFPPAYISDEAGQPMHSWRALILPYIVEELLYEEYRFDEPWNSEHNRALAKSHLPMCYESPFYYNTPPGYLTNYQLITGPGTAFEGSNSIQLSDIEGDASDVAILVENFDRPVLWSQPVDTSLEDFVAKKPFNGAVRNAIHVLYADGSAKRIDETIDQKELQAMPMLIK
ncbi:MAG: hypothetical protein COA78_37990 [Blastopirellula sp.]|nr:MAG: hypothetical protein COA78_37990 [Blastopirellula sp.]